METRDRDIPAEPIEAAEAEAAHQISTKSPLRGLMVAGGGVVLGLLLVLLFLYT